MLAAQRAGVSRVVVPKDNEPDLGELPQEAREQVEFVLADTIDDVLEAAFDGHAHVARVPVGTAQGRVGETREAGRAAPLALVEVVPDGADQGK